jgi:hypothetical protein
VLADTSDSDDEYDQAEVSDRFIESEDDEVSISADE